MADRPSDSGEPGAEDQTFALLGLHKLAGDFEGVELPGLRPGSIGDQLRAVAEAPEDEISQSARLAVLHALARKGYPGRDDHSDAYRRFAETVAGPQNVDAARLLDDLAESARTQTPFRESGAGREIEHHVAAFIGENVCHIRRVDVDGQPAVWIFSEFETDAPFANVAEWVDPRNWPLRGPMLFKKMELVGSPRPTPIERLSPDHWHGVFHEQVQLIRRVDTLLHCDYWEDGESAGMTYDLSLSIDDQLEVDRGFLLVNDLGDMRRVKALKIVGFKEERWDRIAQLVCPYWTDWVRHAVEGGTTSTPREPTGEPTSAPSSGPVEGLMKAWVDFFGDAAGEYIELFSDVFGRVRAGGYSLSDWVEDGTAYWDRLARDWAKAWSYGLDLLDDVSEGGLASDFSPPGDARRHEARPLMAAAAAGGPAAAAVEGTLVPVRGLDPEDQPRCTELVSIESRGFTIPAADIQLSVEQLADGSYGVRVGTAADAPPGLYVGRLVAADGTTLSSLQLYLSRAKSSGSGGP